MSRWTHGTPSTNSCRNSPAVSAPPSRGPTFLMSATDESMPRAVVGGQRERPHPLADAVGRGLDLLAPGVVVAHQAGDLLAERDDARTGERGEVDHRGGLVLGRERERVGEDEPPFGVGVEHLDGLAVADPQHVARSDRGAARHVLDQRDVTGDAASSRRARAAPTSRRSPPPHPTCRSSSSPCPRRS